MTRRSRLLLTAGIVTTAAVVVGALHVHGTTQSLRATRQVSIQPAGLACADGGEGYADLREVPLLADAFRFPDEPAEPGFADDWTGSGFQVLVSDDTDVRCVLSVGVRKEPGATVDLRSVRFGGWAPEGSSGYPLVADPRRAELLGAPVSVPDESIDAVYQVDRTLAADDITTTVQLPFRQRPDTCDSAGLGSRGIEARLRVDGREQVVPADFQVVVRVDDEQLGDCS